jgi:hypothetical protein
MTRVDRDSLTGDSGFIFTAARMRRQFSAVSPYSGLEKKRGTCNRNAVVVGENSRATDHIIQRFYPKSGRFCDPSRNAESLTEFPFAKRLSVGPFTTPVDCAQLRLF